MKNSPLLIAAFLGCSLACVFVPAPEQPQASPALHFRAQEIGADLGVVYAVLIADVNSDGNPDVVAINETQAMWFENPSWQKHVILDGMTEKDTVSIAAQDIDGDGALDFALGAAWRPRDTAGGGTLQWIERGGEAAEPWTMHAIGFEPTLHRMRWADVDADGKQELIVAPLHGRGTAPPNWWEGNGARLLVLRPPADPANQPWPQEVADDTLHIVHNVWATNFDSDPAEEILTASYEGVHVLDRGSDGTWSKRKLGDGFDGEEIKGAGEIKLGRLENGRRYLSTVEPWHANHIVIYEEPADPSATWNRRILSDQLGGGHALWAADLDGDGDEELAVGWREKGQGDFAQPGVAVFDPGGWEYQIIDAGGMATEDLTVADLNQDGRADIIAGGRATSNVKIYWNEAQ
jgi:hypothetical protein